MKIIFAQSALDDLYAYQDFLAGRIGIESAEEYVRKLETHCDTLLHFPERGTKQTIGGRRIRYIVYRRKVLIGYRIDNDLVTIINFLFKGQNALMPR